MTKTGQGENDIMRKVLMLLKMAEQKLETEQNRNSTSVNVNGVSSGTNEHDFVLKVVSLEDCEILVESIKARRHDDDNNKKKKPHGPKTHRGIVLHTSGRHSALFKM